MAQAAGSLDSELQSYETSSTAKWLIALSVVVGTFLSVMDATVVNVAMPHMMGSFGTDLLTITWVSTAYSMAEIVMVTMAAWFTELLGRKRLFLLSMTLFTAGSILAGTSQSFHQMIFYRVLQGIGGGSLMPCSQAIAREAFPPAEQGMAMALYSMGVILAPAVGPVIGGLLVDKFGWRWVFYINVPICIAGLMMVSAFVHDPPYLKRGIKKVDWWGIALLTIGLTALQTVAERGEEVDWFSNQFIVLGSIVAVVALIALITWELKCKEPIVELRLFRNRLLSVGCALGAATSFALFGTSFLLPQFTENLLNYPAYQAGLVLMPRAVAMFLAMPLIGRIYNHVNPRLLVGGGMLIMAYSYWQLAHFDVYIGFWSFAPILALAGLGMGMSTVTLSTLSLSTMPRRSMTGAAGLFTLTRREVGNIAYALLATVLARRTQYHRSVLVTNISSLNSNYMQGTLGFSAGLRGFGINSVATGSRDLAMANMIVNRHATMLAYNDVFVILPPVLICSLVLLFLLPKKAYVGESPESIH